MKTNKEIEKKRTTHKHGYTYNDRIYRIWHNMKTRCYNPNYKGFHNYGGKGIVVCDEWKDDFEAFKEWAFENGYNDNLTIDRIDSNKSYCPENCQWISLSLNSAKANHTGDKYRAISPDGEVFILDEYSHFCAEHNLNQGNVSRMIHNKGLHSVQGWKFEII